MQISTIYVRSYSFAKTIIFMVHVKKKNMSSKKSYLKHLFCLLHNPKGKLIFKEILCARSACEDVHMNFLFEISWHLKMYQICIS
jgi:hypothetical protein